MPETIGSFIAFLLLITPGLVFELLRERSRPERVRSTFRETSVVVVASVAFSSVALGVLLVARVLQPGWIPSPTDLAESPGRYATDHLRLVARSFTIHLVLACGIAFGWHRLLRWKFRGGEISANPAWFEIVRGNANPRKDRVLMVVELQDGSAVRGVVKGYDLKPDQTLRTLVLGSNPANPLTTRQAATGAESPVGSDWAYVVVPGDEIKIASVAFVDP
jgi:hypothetical protein